MVSDPHDRWLFLLAVAAVPLACSDDAPLEPDGSTGATGSTTAPPPPTSATETAEGSTSIATTSVDETSSSGADTTVVDGSTSATSSTGSDGTTMSIEPGTSTTDGEGSSSTGELGLCEAWAHTQAGCYYYYNELYLTNYCYNYLTYVDPACLTYAQHRISCQAYEGGCFPDCSFEYDSVQQCNDDILAMELGCDLIPIVPGVGTINAQCTDLVAQATVCDSAGYYIPGFSNYIQYAPEYAEYFCQHGAYFTYLFPPPGVGDPCGGAYEEMLTCLSGLTCDELANEMFFPTVCATQDDALTCRCDLEN